MAVMGVVRTAFMRPLPKVVPLGELTDEAKAKDLTSYRWSFSSESDRAWITGGFLWRVLGNGHFHIATFDNSTDAAMLVTRLRYEQVGEPGRRPQQLIGL